MLGQHVCAGDTQLDVTVDADIGADISAIESHVAAVLLRVNGNRANANDGVACLVGLSGYRNGQQCRGEKGCKAEAGCES
jgi:hypothetical protein